MKDWQSGHRDRRETPQSERFTVSFDPPLVHDIKTDQDRERRLAAIVADAIVPRLIELHESIIGTPPASDFHPGAVEVAELARLVIQPEGSEALAYVLQLRDAGLSLDDLHTELLEPTARHLGESWSQDRLDFLDVSIGLNGLQKLVHVFAGLDRISPYDEMRRALIIAVPGEQHMLGVSIVQRFFRAAGWYVCAQPAAHVEELIATVSQEWFGIVGFSLATDRGLEGLSAAVAAVRKHSLNRDVGVIVGGPAFAADDGKAVASGADGTAANAPAAVILAKKLLAKSLLKAVE